MFVENMNLTASHLSLLNSNRSIIFSDISNVLRVHCAGITTKVDTVIPQRELSLELLKSGMVGSSGDLWFVTRSWDYTAGDHIDLISQNVFITPFPWKKRDCTMPHWIGEEGRGAVLTFILIGPLLSIMKPPMSVKQSQVTWLIWIFMAETNKSGWCTLFVAVGKFPVPPRSELVDAHLILILL